MNWRMESESVPFPVPSAACPDGSYGYYCIGQCGCRSSRSVRVVVGHLLTSPALPLPPSECRKTDGVCVCDGGYAGPSCHQPCPEGTFGPGCRSSCSCSPPGTESCDHITGLCSCLSNWTGSLCNEQSEAAHTYTCMYTTRGYCREGPMCTSLLYFTHTHACAHTHTHTQS